MASQDDPGDVVQALYSLLSGPADRPRDWDAVRALFLPDVVLRSELTLPDGTRQSGEWTLDEFCEAASAEYREAGFWEREIHASQEEFGHIAHVWTTYESRVEHADSEPVGRGINSIQLLRRDGRWRIAGLIFQVERGTPGIPEAYLGPAEVALADPAWDQATPGGEHRPPGRTEDGRP